MIFVMLNSYTLVFFSLLTLLSENTKSFIYTHNSLKLGKKFRCLLSFFSFVATEVGHEVVYGIR